jgi:hypothetical protein
MRYQYYKNTTAVEQTHFDKAIVGSIVAHT